MLITSKDNNRIKEVRKLLNNKYSKDLGLFVIEGENLIEEAIKNNLLVSLYVLEGYNCKYNFEFDYVTLDVMKSISDLSIIDEIKNKGIIVIGTSLHTNNSLESLEHLDKYAVIFGNEGNGIREEILNKCDKLIKIDMNNACESLNVGVSSGIVLYHLYRG